MHGPERLQQRIAGAAEIRRLKARIAELEAALETARKSEIELRSLTARVHSLVARVAVIEAKHKGF